jgi:hypothetical protein
MPKTPAETWAEIVRDLPPRTGRSLEEWLSVLDGCPHAKRLERIAWLREHHRLGYGQAQVIVDEAATRGDDTSDRGVGTTG